MQFVRKIETKDSGILPNELLLFLQPRDPKSVTLGKSFSSQTISWFACEDKLAFVSNVNNGVLIKIDFSDYLSDYCMITCGEEVILPGFSSALLVLGCETNLGGLILFYHPTLRQMIKIVEVDVGVSVINVLSNGYRTNPLLPELLTCMDGILAVGGIDGSLILLDLQYSVLKKVLKADNDSFNNNLAWPSKMSKLHYISRQTDTWNSIKQKIELCKTTHDSLAFLLNDNEGDLIAPKHGNTYSAVTCLHYCPIVASLFVGFEVGVWQMWSMLDFELLFSSKSELGSGVSVVGLSLMEPCDDPRHYLYLWVGHSQTSRPAFIHRNTMRGLSSPPNSPLPNYPPLVPSSQEPPFSLIYSLSFNSKSTIDSYGLLYSDFYKCDDIFELEMVKELDSFVSGRILSVNSLICANPHRKYQSNREDDKEMLRVWSIVWECEFEEIDGKTVYVTLFDLNQWYNKMPGRPEVITGLSSNALPMHDTPYLSTWRLPPSSPEDQPLSLWIDPQSLEAFRFLNQLDVHYYPSNISFGCIKVSTTGICHGEGVSVLNEFKNKLKLNPSAAMAHPEPLFQACFSLGILPNFDDTSSLNSITINADMARRYLLTICVENGLVGVILGCARYWYDSACTETTVSLDYLVDFLWDLFNTYNRKIDELCVSLFDYSGVELNYLDSIKMKLLNQYMKDIKAVYSVLSRDYSTFKKIYIVKHRYLAIEIKTFYVDLVVWFTSHNFLPESSSSAPDGSALPYNYEKMRTYVNARRNKYPLLIDEMLMHWISGVVGDWKRESGDKYTVYPPCSIQDIIRISLIADIEPSIKHFFILYFLQDLLACLTNERFTIDAEKIIHNYAASFRVQQKQMRIVLSYRDIDTKHFKEGVERLLHRTVKNSDLEVWEHRHIIVELYKHNEYALAFRYLKGMQPPLGTCDDNKMEISLNVSLGNISSAFFITKQWSQKRHILLKHFFQECLRMNRIKYVYPLPMDKYDEDCFLEFLRSCGLKTANDLLLYFYIDRHRYPEAFVLYNKMKQLGQCGGQDKNSKKRDIIMKNLEARFDPKLLLLQKSKCEAKNTLPPSGFFEEQWKPTSHYLKFDDSNPKKPLLKSSIKELAFITVWQGQKLSRMQSNQDLKVVSNGMDAAPLIERVKVLEKSELSDYSRKRLRETTSSVGSILKKPKLLDRLLEEVLDTDIEPSTPCKKMLNYSIIEELVSTPRIEQKTPRNRSPLPGPPSILRVRSDKKEEISSCDESSSATPKKKLKFSLPTSTEEKKEIPAMNASKPLKFDEGSDDSRSDVSVCEEDHISNREFVKDYNPQADLNNIATTEEKSDVDFSEEEENLSETDSSSKGSHASSLASQEEISEKRMSLEDRLQQLRSGNRKLNSFMNDILSPSKESVQDNRDIPFTKDAECSFISSHSSELAEDIDAKTVSINEPTVEDKEQTPIETGWRLEGNSVQNISEPHYEIIDNNSSASDSMDKVYTSVGAPVRKLSTVFETEGENEEPCPIVSDHMNAEAAVNDQKDSFGVIIRSQGNYQESDLGDEKLDQDCDYNMQFGHDNYTKDFDTESENNNEEMDEEGDYLPVAQNKENVADYELLICLDTDSDGDRVVKKNYVVSDTYSQSGGEDESSSKSSFSRSQDDEHSEADEYDEESEESMFENEEIDDEEDDEDEFKKEVHPDSDIEELNNDEQEYSEEGSECENISLLSEQDSLPDSHIVEIKPVSEVIPSDTFKKAEVGFLENNQEMNKVTQRNAVVLETSKIQVDMSGEKVKPSEIALNIESNEEVKVTPCINPVDPSLLEKIVSFSKTVSEEQLKGLVDVVKTTIDATKTKVGNIPEIEIKASSDSKSIPNTPVSCKKSGSRESESHVLVSKSDVDIEIVEPTSVVINEAREIVSVPSPSEDQPQIVSLQPSSSPLKPAEISEEVVKQQTVHDPDSIYSSSGCESGENVLVSSVISPLRSEIVLNLSECGKNGGKQSRNSVNVDSVEREDLKHNKDESDILEAVQLQPVLTQTSTISNLVCNENVTEILPIKESDKKVLKEEDNKGDHLLVKDSEAKLLQTASDKQEILEADAERKLLQTDDDEELKLEMVEDNEESLLMEDNDEEMLTEDKEAEHLHLKVGNEHSQTKVICTSKPDYVEVISDSSESDGEPEFVGSFAAHLQEDNIISIKKETVKHFDSGNKVQIDHVVSEYKSQTGVSDLSSEDVTKNEEQTSESCVPSDFSNREMIMTTEICHESDLPSVVDLEDAVIHSKDPNEQIIYLPETDTGTAINLTSEPDVQVSQMVISQAESRNNETTDLHQNTISGLCKNTEIKIIPTVSQQEFTDITNTSGKATHFHSEESKTNESKAQRNADVFKETINQENRGICLDTEQGTDSVSRDVRASSCKEAENIEVIGADIDQENESSLKNTVERSRKISDSLQTDDLESHHKTCDYPESLVVAKDIASVDASNEHMVTVIAGNKTIYESDLNKKTSEVIYETVTHTNELLLDDSSSKILEDGMDTSPCRSFVECDQKSALKDDSSNDHMSSFNTAVCDQLSYETAELDNSVEISELNTAMVLEDESLVLNTPRLKTETSISKHKGYDLLVDSSVSTVSQKVVQSVKSQSLGTDEVGREVKAPSKSRKKVETVDKCIMTDRKRHSKKNKIEMGNVAEIVLKKEDTEKDIVEEKLKPKLVDRSMITDKRGIDVTVIESEVQTSTRKSSRRSSSPEDRINENQQVLSKGESDNMDFIQNLPLNHNSIELVLHTDVALDENPSSFAEDDILTKNNDLHDPSKPVRVLKKGIRRSLKSNRPEADDKTLKDKENDTQSDTVSVPEEIEPVSGNGKSANKLVRKMRKVVRRRSSVTSQETSSLVAIPENNELIIDGSGNTQRSSSSLRRRSKSSSELDVLSVDDEHASSLQNINTQKLTNKGMLKYSSTEDLSSASTEGTPRRSTRISKPTDFFSSPSSTVSETSDLTVKKMKLSSKQLEFEEEPDSNHSALNSRKSMRRSKLSHRSELEDIVEVSESDLESTNSGDRAKELKLKLPKSRSLGVWEPHSKTDLTLLALQKAGTSRRRTLSSSSEPQMTGSDSENYSDPQMHWLRSFTRSDNSESTIGSHSSYPKTKSQRRSEGDVLHSSTHTKKLNVSKIDKQAGSKASGDESDTEAPQYSPLTIEDSSPQHKVVEDTQSKRRSSKRHSVCSSNTAEGQEEHAKPARIRKRTLSSSSEPPPVISHSPNKDKYFVEPINASVDVKKKTRSLKHPVFGNLTGLDMLNAGSKIKKRSKSLHEGHLPFKPLIVSLTEASDGHGTDRGTLHQHSPQFAALMDEYSENRRLTRHQKSLIEKSFESSPRTPEPTTTPKRRRRSSIAAGSEDESTPVRSSKRLQEKAHKKDG